MTGDRKHFISNINEETRTADCKECGVGVEIMKGGPETKNKDKKGQQHWRCATSVRNAYKPRTTTIAPHEHKLSEIDEQSMTAICKKCGPVDIKSRGEEYKGKKRYRCANYKSPAAPKKERRRNYLLNYVYGITEEQYQEMVLAQNGLCAICHRPPDDQRFMKLYVDHCHVTNKARGLLCRLCNLGVGHLRDSVEVLESAIAYLKSYQGKEQEAPSLTDQAGVSIDPCEMTLDQFVHANVDDLLATAL